MSGKAEDNKRKPDRRVKRTRDALGDALIELFQEKTFEDISVQEILDRAGISRSTFYTHYRDKDDLFLSDVEEFLDLISNLLLRSRENSNRVAPVRELFAHVAEMRQFQRALLASDKLHDFLELARGHFARAMDRRLAELPATASMPVKQRTPMSQAFAGALFALMLWWVNQTNPATPAEMDDIFHQMVWSGVKAQAGEKK